MIKEKIKKYFDFCEKKYNIMMYISLVMIFMYIYNIGFKEYIYFNQLIIILNFVIAGILLLSCNMNSIKKNIKCNSKHKKFIISLIILFCFITIRNGDIINHHFGAPFYSIYAVFLLFVLSYTDNWYNIFKNIIIFFTIEHIAATIFCYLFPNIYLRYILPLFPKSVHEMLIAQFNAGEIAGITQHYSTNALYLAVGFIINVYNFEKKEPRKKRVLYYILIAFNFFALLLTGKRVQVIFPLASLLFVQIIKNLNNLKKFAKRFLLSCTVLIVTILICSLIVPSILTPFKRTVDGIVKGDMFDSRKPLYSLAIKEFKEKPIFGIGWGNYKYVYYEKMKVKEMDLMDTHNIYLQILCELGLVGFVFFTYIFLFLLIYSIKMLIKELNKRKKDNKKIRTICLFITIHIYFLMEGLFGNPLYDVMIYMPYVCVLSNFINIRLKKKE